MIYPRTGSWKNFEENFEECTEGSRMRHKARNTADNAHISDSQDKPASELPQARYSQTRTHHHVDGLRDRRTERQREVEGGRHMRTNLHLKHTHMHAYAHMHTHVRTRTHTRTYTPTHTHTHNYFHATLDFGHPSERRPGVERKSCTRKSLHFSPVYLSF